MRIKGHHCKVTFLIGLLFTKALDSGFSYGEPSRSPQIGLLLGRASIEARGYRSATIPVSPITRFFAVLDLTASSALQLYTETNLSTYMSSGVTYRYFPFSVSSPRTLKNKNLHIEYSDPFKPFLSLGLSLGRVRLETKDEIGATEISAIYYGPDGDGGVSYEIFDHWNLDAVVTYSILIASSDSTVDFKGTRLTVMLGASHTL